jgi:tetratricopeptide (TPR) repeat protein
MRFLRQLFGKASEPEPLESESEAPIESTLRELGLPLDFSITDPQTAFIGGFAKATIFHGYQALKAGDLEKAISAFASVVDLLTTEGDPKFSEPLAVAHYLRGTAYEKKQMVKQALDDYTSALSFSPTHEAAREGYERLSES